MNSDRHPLPRADRDTALFLAGYLRGMVSRDPGERRCEDREILCKTIRFLVRIADEPSILADLESIETGDG